MKVVIAGDAQVGKTSLIDRFTNKRFRNNTTPTIGAAFQTHIMNTPKGTVTLQIWDTAGQEKYRALAPMYFRSATVAILCFDVTNIDSFTSLDIWMNELESKAPPGIPIIVAGNKIDMAKTRIIDYENAKKYADAHNIFKYVEVSAKTGEGVDKLFEIVADIFFEQQKTVEKKDNPSLPIEKKEENKCC